MMEKSEITKMKLQIAGYIGQVALLQKNIKDFEAIIKKKNGVIDELSNQVFDLQTSKDELANMLADSKEDASSLETTIDTYYSSWWHRIFG